MSVNIKYKNNSIAELSDTGTKTLKTAGKYCEADIIFENTKDGITPSGNKAITATTSTQTGIDVTNYATVSVAPTPSETKSVTTNGDVTPSSGKLLSKVTVNVPTGTARDSSDLTVSGATVNVPAGLYSSAASKSVASGTAGTPTASKSAVSNHSVTVTPSVTNTEGYISGGTKTGTGVKVSASELVSGNKAITPSETAQSGIDVTNFKTASVGAISSTYVGSGVTKKAAATVAPSTSEQTVCASGVYTTGEQKVSAITPSIVGNLDASNFAASIVAAVEGKGVTVPDGTLLDGMAALIESIEAGGGGNQSPLKIGHKSIIGAQSGIASIDFSDAGITQPYLLYAKLADNLEAVGDHCILEFLAIKKAGTYREYVTQDSAFLWKLSKDGTSVETNAPGSSPVSSVFGYADAMGAVPITVKDGIVYIYFEVSTRFNRFHYGHEYDVYLIGY